MKTARELFEELGYTCEKSNGEVIVYRYYTTDSHDEDAYIHEIDFCLNFKKYCVIEHLGGLYIDTETHKAITKQLEELGWLE